MTAENAVLSLTFLLEIKSRQGKMPNLQIIFTWLIHTFICYFQESKKKRKRKKEIASVSQIFSFFFCNAFFRETLAVNLTLYFVNYEV